MIPRVPDDWRVWTFADPHGVTSGLIAALREAGIVDEDQRWIAQPRTALIGCGDYIDRGSDSRGIVDLLRRLASEAAGGGGRVLLARGNHEHLPLLLRAGFDWFFDLWLHYGGRATLRSFGCADPGLDGPSNERAAAALGELDRRAPGLFDWMAALPQAIRWRDVLFVHGGLPPWTDPADLGRTTEEHLWIRRGFFETPWESGAFAGYERAGIRRVVFGHTPSRVGPRRFHDGRSVCLDTNACGNPGMPPDALALVTLLGLDGDVALEAGRYVLISTQHAPDRRHP